MRIDPNLDCCRSGFYARIFHREDGQILNPVTPAMTRGASSEILRLIRNVNPARFPRPFVERRGLTFFDLPVAVNQAI